MLSRRSCIRWRAGRLRRANRRGSAEKLPRVGFLGAEPPAGQLDPFVQGLHELSYAEGQNIILDVRHGGAATGNNFDSLAAELVALKPDVLVAAADAHALAFKRATSTIPIVFGTSADPVGNGLVESLAHPGGNVTGLSDGLAQTGSKYLDLLGELIPGLSQVGVLHSVSLDAPMGPQIRSVEAGARALNIRVQLIEFTGIEDFEAAFRTAANAKLQAVIVPASGFTAVVAREAPQMPLDLAIKYRLPTVSNNRILAVVAYGANVDDNRRRAAGYVDRILKGAKPADLPVQEPTKFDLVINLKLAQAIGITVPPTLLSQATEVVQ